MKKVKLNDLLEAIEHHSEELQSFIHLETGEVCSISDESIQIAESDDNYPNWQEEEVKIAKDY